MYHPSPPEIPSWALETNDPDLLAEASLRKMRGAELGSDFQVFDSVLKGTRADRENPFPLYK